MCIHQQLNCGVHFEDTTVIEKAGKLASVSIFFFFSLKGNVPMSLGKLLALT